MQAIRTCTFGIEGAIFASGAVLSLFSAPSCSASNLNLNNNANTTFPPGG